MMNAVKDYLIALKLYTDYVGAVNNCFDVSSLIELYKKVKHLEPQTKLDKALYKDILSLIKEKVKEVKDNDN